MKLSKTVTYGSLESVPLCGSVSIQSVCVQLFKSLFNQFPVLNPSPFLFFAFWKNWSDLCFTD